MENHRDKMFLQETCESFTQGNGKTQSPDFKGSFKRLKVTSGTSPTFDL